MRSIATQLSLLSLSLSLVPAVAAQDTFRWSGRVNPGNEVEVIGVAADIEAVGGGSTVEVTATGLEDGARVEVEQRAGGVTFCVVHAGMRRTGEGRCSQNGGNERRNWSWRNHEDVEVHVRVPAGVRFSASTVSGDVDVQGLTGDVDAHSVSGDVHVETRGMVEAGSVSGDLDIEMGRVPQNGSLEFKSVSGDVQISLPASTGAELRASTLSGDIESDFPLEMSGRDRDRGRFHVEVGRRARGTIGNGGVRLEVETVSGDITVRRRGR
jgi:hypothetical protein